MNAPTSSTLAPSRSVAYFLVTVGLIASIIVGLRYYQRHLNIALLNLDTHSSQININPYRTHHVGFIMSRFPHNINWDDILHRLPPQDSDDLQNELRLRLELFSYYDLYSAEKRYLDFIVEHAKGTNDYSHTLKWYVDRYLSEEILELFDTGQYEKARFRAQTYINLVSSLPPIDYLAKASRALAIARTAVEFADKAYPYDPRFTEDRTEYNVIAAEYRGLRDPRQWQEWENFIRKYPYSIKTDEASINIIYYKLNNLTLDPTTKKGIRDQFLDFLSQHPKSYLADDAIWYAMKLSIELKDRKTLLDLFKKLVLEYPQSDHSRRLRYEIGQWLGKKHRMAIDTSDDVVSFLFALPTQSVSKLNESVASSFSSSQEKDKLQYPLTYLINRYYGMQQMTPPKSLASIQADELAISLLSFWAMETAAK